MKSSDSSQGPARTKPPVGGGVEVLDPEGRVTGVAWLRERAAGALRELGASGEVRVRVVGDAEMAAAHEEFMGVAGTTDVLTFDLTDPDEARREPPVLDADILVCADEAGRHAAARGHGVERELLLYIVHGVLHCLGYDDHDEVAAAAMHAREDEVLAAIGVGATYAEPSARRADLPSEGQR